MTNNWRSSRRFGISRDLLFAINDAGCRIIYSAKIRRTKLIGSLRDFPTKAAAWRAAESFRQTVVE